MSDNTLGRRGLLRTAVAGAALLPVAGAAPAAAAAGEPQQPGGGETAFTWLGNSGWRIEGNGRTVLFDPYLTRYPTHGFDPKTPLTVDPAAVDPHLGTPDLVLVSHSHWDHVNDVPHIATSRGVRVVGTATTCHLLQAMGVDPAQLIVVKGGEVLDFGGFTVRVVAALHSRNAKHRYWAPGTLTAPPAQAPTTIGELVEGDTLAFQVQLGDGPQTLLTGASDFVEHTYAGLRPDVAMIAVESTARTTHRYVPRLLRALDFPRTVVPVHWDVFETPLTDPAVQDPSMDLDGLLTQVRALAPRTRLIRPEHLGTLRLRA
ncbi:L-ascorbate metabolism protein UlaG (beta-lactamase superfamily) [Kitasatospora sp. SolWspMP-SS2h]|uniref:MBL fold metallo-hydrolase n=1 Tax=Kitasatospora sp. SolWspMP-SS2h TaxID=1305729 RepID=UPI000DBA2DF4|nr:MBL fold metallo-hydrolase [Kitasatospora sp. SolWspMP-SS2h]RAJ45482.1 L-ascorbate metabolism protein UlaG (beta-lactamase superfamily) [Kitasatospora sp. SolWspMP-SS2h]